MNEMKQSQRKPNNEHKIQHHCPAQTQRLSCPGKIFPSLNIKRVLASFTLPAKSSNRYLTTPNSQQSGINGVQKTKLLTVALHPLLSKQVYSNKVDLFTRQRGRVRFARRMCSLFEVERSVLMIA